MQCLARSREACGGRPAAGSRDAQFIGSHIKANKTPDCKVRIVTASGILIIYALLLKKFTVFKAREDFIPSTFFGLFPSSAPLFGGRTSIWNFRRDALFIGCHEKKGGKQQRSNCDNLTLRSLKSSHYEFTHNPPPPENGPPWLEGGTLFFWALEGRILFRHWSHFFCLFPLGFFHSGVGRLFGIFGGGPKGNFHLVIVWIKAWGLHFEGVK